MAWKPKGDLLDVGGFKSKLPDAHVVLGPLGLPPSGVPADWAQKSIETATLLAGHFLQGVATTSGWPGSPVPLDSLIGTAKAVMASDGNPLGIAHAVINLVQQTGLLQQILEAPLQEVQNLVVSALTDVLGEAVVAAGSVVPFVGWVVTIIKSSVVIARTIEANNERGFGVLPGTLEGLLQGVVPSFSRARDEDATNAMLAVLRGDDWTDIWMPSIASWSKLALDYDGDGKIDGWYFGAGISGGLATNVEMPGGVWAAIPGMAQLGGAFFGTTHFGASKTSTQSISVIYPSLNQLAGLAWTRLQVPTGQCCNVRLKKVDYTWGLWQAEGRRFLETGGMTDMSDRKIVAARKMVAAALGFRYLDGHLLRSGLYPGSAGRMGSTKYVRDRVHEACKAMKARIHRLLGTIAVAYVPPDAPALQDDLELRVRYAAMRNALLKHRARYEVDLDLVPDQAYRNMLWESRMQLAAPDKALRLRRTLDGGAAPEPPSLPDVPGNGQEATEDSGLGWLAAATVVAVVAWAGLRRRR